MRKNKLKANKRYYLRICTNAKVGKRHIRVSCLIQQVCMFQNTNVSPNFS